jgi:ketosteroid isomerase-like protein
MKNTILLVFTLLLLTGSAIAECSDADKKALAAFDAAWSKAGLNGDKAALMNIYADDYAGLPGMQSKTSAIDATMRTFEQNKANPAGADKVTYDHYIITCTANTATVTHRNTVWTPEGAGGKPETFYTRSVHVLEKRGGAWQVVSNAGNDLDDYAVLWYLEQDWNNAIWKKDKAWFEKTYAPDFTSISSQTAKVMSRSEDIADTMNDKSTYDLVETTGMNIRIDGNFAIVTGTFRVRGKDEKGAAIDRKTRYTDTWIKRDGRWQAWSSHGTNIPAVAETVAKQ